MSRGAGTVDIKEHLASLPPLPEGDVADVDTDDGGRASFTDYGDDNEPEVLPARARDDQGRFLPKEPVKDVTDEEDVLNLRVGDPTEDVEETEEEKPDQKTEETKETTETTEEAKAEEEAQPESPEKLWGDLRGRIANLPEAEQARILLSLGYIDEATAEPYLKAEKQTETQAAETTEEDELYAAYEPVGAIEKRLHPVLNDIVGMPSRIKAQEENFTALTTELNQVLVAQRDALDAAVIQNAANAAYQKHLAELMQYEFPTLDMKAAVEAIRKGKALETVIEEQMKPVLEKNKARAEQARKPRPATVGETANGHVQIEKTDDMSTIARKIRGLE